MDARVHAPAAALPAPQQWPAINEDEDAYRHVEARGLLLQRCETLVTAITELGGGYWVMTPLETDTGIVLINRGFVPSEKRDPASRAGSQPDRPVTITGLLRLSEPNGTMLRGNDPKAGRWFSRDVQAIGAACGLTGVAPFFIDADATPNPGGYPVGGLTVVSFSNNHLIYALTWLGLAALSAFGGVLMLRTARSS